MDKLLIIEDDETIRNALRILLENQGYFIEEAHDGEEGLQKFDSTFDLLIIDIMMPIFPALMYAVKSGKNHMFRFSF